jgi:hypothetical protein
MQMQTQVVAELDKVVITHLLEVELEVLVKWLLKNLLNLQQIKVESGINKHIIYTFLLASFK